QNGTVHGIFGASLGAFSLSGLRHGPRFRLECWFEAVFAVDKRYSNCQRRPTFRQRRPARKFLHETARRPIPGGPFRHVRRGGSWGLFVNPSVTTGTWMFTRGLSTLDRVRGALDLAGQLGTLRLNSAPAR